MIELTDVTLRDGLQMESKRIAVKSKLVLLKRLLACPYARLEITSFVNPKWVPQFKDSEAFCAGAFKAGLDGARAMAFVPNEKGLERLLRYPIEWVSCFVATSETFNRKNVNASIAESLREIAKIVQRARAAKRKTRVYLSTSFGCPYEGEVKAARVGELVRRIAAADPEEIALGDTIGVAVPTQVAEVVSTVASLFPVERTAMHFHDTYGLALGAAQTAYDRGVRKFDGSTGGVGGCPYAKGATGNLATEALAYAFFRQAAFPSFPLDPFARALRCLKNDLKLKVRSHLFEILQKGGTLYAVR